MSFFPAAPNGFAQRVRVNAQLAGGLTLGTAANEYILNRRLSVGGLDTIQVAADAAPRVGGAGSFRFAEGRRLVAHKRRGASGMKCVPQRHDGGGEDVADVQLVGGVGEVV